MADTIKRLREEFPDHGPVFWSEPGFTGRRFPPEGVNKFNIELTSDTYWPSFSTVGSLWVPSNTEVKLWNTSGGTYTIRPVAEPKVKASLTFAAAKWSDGTSFTLSFANLNSMRFVKSVDDEYFQVQSCVATPSVACDLLMEQYCAENPSAYECSSLLGGSAKTGTYRTAAQRAAGSLENTETASISEWWYIGAVITLILVALFFTV